MQDILSALPTLLDMQGDNDEVRRSVVFSVWRRIAGESLLDHAVPVDLQNEKLIVAVADRNWQRNIEQLAGEMVFKMNFALGSRIVTFIEFVIDKSRFEDSMRKRADRAESEHRAAHRDGDRRVGRQRSSRAGPLAESMEGRRRDARHPPCVRDDRGRAVNEVARRLHRPRPGRVHQDRAGSHAGGSRDCAMAAHPAAVFPRNESAGRIRGR